MWFKRRAHKWVGIGFTISGVICLAVTLVLVVFAWRFVAMAARADGQVIEMVERKGNDGSTYAPVFTFRDAKGTDHTIHSSLASYPPDYRVGDSVRVLYSHKDPRGAKIDGFFSLWGLPLITGIIGVSHLGIGAVVLFIAFWRNAL